VNRKIVYILFGRQPKEKEGGADVFLDGTIVEPREISSYVARLSTVSHAMDEVPVGILF
jgi:hypothetical protein